MPPWLFPDPFPLTKFGGDDLASAGAKMISRSVQRMSTKMFKSAAAPPAENQRSNRSKSTKSVHFEAQLESVCYFMKDDEPCLIAARISAVTRTNGACDPLKELKSESSLLLHDSTCVLDMISQSADRKDDAPVRVEQVYLSNRKNVTGTLAVANVSFAEHVKVRFTLDGWKTVSETAAEYFGNHRHKGFDTFGFTISLEDQKALKDKTMSFYVCYVANGMEIMDNNNSMNYQVELSKFAHQTGKSSPVENANATATSKSLPQSPATVERASAQASPPGILRLTSSSQKVSKASKYSAGNQLFAPLSRQLKAEVGSFEGKKHHAEVDQGNVPLFKYMDRLSSNANVLSSSQIRLL
ncbi:phosphatase regulatory subunit family protein [Coccidioides posadasii C735 delta SOWgp]|uniref:Phosphatase regulatory subunit family protein n=1 Tax=Coccidioides posadasii (strain C735) TaxID=222929 RepID=C5PE55_COCP7|nr:phosphatase regulatory subunit family protein [Coccidioides posadasii C735 delta SOWgp]EER24788.1 phosphatase regulatory subunit family protein [Coccidioides posadasii C735 delta SOWgp]|eukprot:XP_003066933.1 phosphatase regulatory subunit family protein [Coccidioides posadasii C735 delta SOWgp]